MAATPPLVLSFTLDAALARLIAEFKPPITRPHDVVSISVTRTEIVATVLERDDHGWPLINKVAGQPPQYATIKRRQQITQTIMETDE